MNRSVKDQIAAAFRPHPRLFDVVKRVSRWCGDTNNVHQFLKGFAKKYPACVFLQIGSNDGMLYDPLREFIISEQWRGVFVEPIPHLFEKLKHNYAHVKRSGLHFANVAISDAGGDKPIYTIREDALKRLPTWVSAISSLDREHLIKHCGSEPGIEDAIVERRIECLTPGSLLRKYGFNSVDLIHIDAEGHEQRILASIDWKTIKPQAIIFEIYWIESAAREETYRYLQGHGYRIFHDREGWDTIAVHRDLKMDWCERWQEYDGAIACKSQGA